MSCSSPIHTALLEEGQAIERVGFIKEGNCLAYAKVPNTPRPVQVGTQQCLCCQTLSVVWYILHIIIVQVCIGELGPGSCIGELLLRGRETQPYATVSATQLRVGWVSGTAIRGKCWGATEMVENCQLTCSLLS